jgi:hypothetical protein
MSRLVPEFIHVDIGEDVRTADIQQQPSYSIMPAYYSYDSKEHAKVMIYLHQSPKFKDTLEEFINSKMINYKIVALFTPIQKLCAKYYFKYPNQFLDPPVKRGHVKYLSGLAKQLEFIEKDQGSIDTVTMCQGIRDLGIMTNIPFVPPDVSEIIENYFIFFAAKRNENGIVAN